MTDNHAIDNARGWLETIHELAERMSQSGKDSDLAREEAQESVLSVQVRDGWRSPGGGTTQQGAEEFEVLLSTGGPALRLYGTLDQWGDPDRCALQHQDWFKPWTDYPLSEQEQGDVRTFLSTFYFGD